MKKNSSNAIGINLLMINAFVYISLSLYAPFLTSYYTKAGINAMQIGVLLTIGPVIAIIIQPLWAILSDRTGRRKDVLSLVVLGSGISMFSYYIGRSFLSFFIATLLLSIFSTSIIPLSDAIIIRSASKRGFDFAKIRMGGTIGFAIVVVIAGAFIKQKPSMQFALGFLGYLVLFFFVQGLPKDEHKERSKTIDKPIQKVRNKEEGRGISSIFQTKQVFFVLAYAFISQIGLSFYFGFLAVYLLDLGLGESTIGFINCIAALSELPILFLINRIMRKFGAMKILVAACILMSLRIFTVTGGSLLYIILAQMLHGISFMTIYYSCAVYISDNVKKGKQSQGQSTLAIIQTGIGSIIGNILGGYLVDKLGLKSAYLYMSIMVITVTAIIVMLQIIYRSRTRAKITDTN